MGAGFHGGFGNTYGNNVNYASGELVFRSRDEDYFDNMEKRRDVDPGEKYDVVAHGTPQTVFFKLKGEAVEIDSRMVARILKHRDDFKKKKVVRLLACNTGANADSIAQHLANKLGIVVEAPITTYWGVSNGMHFAAPRRKDNEKLPDLSQVSRLKKFYPGGKKR